MSKLKDWWPFRFERGEKQPVPVTVAPRGPAVAPPSRRSLFGPLELELEPPWGMPSLNLLTPEGFFGDFSPARFTPALDVTDEGSHLRVTAELPGVDAGDVQVAVDAGALTIRGEKRTESSTDENGVYRVERSHGSFIRSIPLPSDVEADAAEATFEKGVLHVRLPKSETEREKPRRIPILR